MARRAARSQDPVVPAPRTPEAAAAHTHQALLEAVACPARPASWAAVAVGLPARRTSAAVAVGHRGRGSAASAEARLEDPADRNPVVVAAAPSPAGPASAAAASRLSPVPTQWASASTAVHSHRLAEPLRETV